jgi:hypothetical protein
MACGATSVLPAVNVPLPNTSGAFAGGPTTDPSGNWHSDDCETTGVNISPWRTSRPAQCVILTLNYKQWRIIRIRAVRYCFCSSSAHLYFRIYAETKMAAADMRSLLRAWSRDRNRRVRLCQSTTTTCESSNQKDQGSTSTSIRITQRNAGKYDCRPGPVQNGTEKDQGSR